MADTIHERIRRATIDDAQAAAGVINAVIAERRYTLFDRPFSVDEERSFIESLGDRQALFIAERDGRAVGLQAIDLLVPFASSMRHVGTIGTWLRPEARGNGLARRMAKHALVFAREQGYEKFVIQVLATNARARRFYEGLGFRDIGLARRHVRIGDDMHDEVYMEAQLADMMVD
jgi:RimJ/RimL family protein N-acetyltransferase